jgi:hypothetical protein
MNRGQITACIQCFEITRLQATDTGGPVGTQRVGWGEGTNPTTL